MPDIADALDIANFHSAALVGSGGKTSLLWHLTGRLRALPGVKTLVTTSTKIGEPPPEWYDSFVEADRLASCEPRPGLTLTGERIAGGKLAAPSMEALELAGRNFDHVLFEADGAHERPLKGWAPYEPVVPPWTGVTIGVLPLWPLGQPVSPSIAHRLDAFSSLTGAVAGDILTVRHLVKIVLGDGGLFDKAQGKRALFLSVSDGLYGEQSTQKIINDLSGCVTDRNVRKISLILAGDARIGACRVVWQCDK